MQQVQEFFVSTFHNPIIATFIIACLPIFELRGAIPFGMNVSFWGAKALNQGTAFLISFIGSSIVVPIIALLFKPILNYLKNTKMFRKIACKFEKRLIDKSKSFENKNTRIKKFLGIILFVGVPLPLTGAYTGTALAVLIGLEFWDTVISVLIGNLIAGGIITLFSSLTPNATNIILIAFVSFIVFMFFVWAIKNIFKKIKQKQIK